MKNTPIRHGDVIFTPCEIPTEAIVVKTTKTFVAALGEATGHSHTLVADKPFTVSKLGDMVYFTFPDVTTIEHQEHKPIVINPGTYKQVQELEKDWFSLSTRKVVD